MVVDMIDGVGYNIGLTTTCKLSFQPDSVFYPLEQEIIMGWCVQFAIFVA